MRKLSDFDDQFNAWVETNLLTIVDEARIHDTPSYRKTMNHLKNFISEPYGKVRIMRVDAQIDKRLYNNVIFFTNEQDALTLANSDRRFNIAPRQTQPLFTKYPELESDLSNLLESELQAFANFICSYKIDVKQARASLNNFAKVEMREASMTWVEEFCHALKEGNLDFFIRFLDMNPTQFHEITLYEPSQRYIKSWIASVNTKDSFVTIECLRTLYNCLNGSDIAAGKFGKLLSRNGISTGARKRFGDNIRRGINVDWKLDAYDKPNVIETYFTKKDKEAYACQLQTKPLN
jgi:hypothetical protein